MDSGDFLHKKHSVGQVVYHIEWTPKYRFKMFRKEEFRRMCEETLREVASTHELEILELNVMPDHIHAIVKAPFKMSPSEAARILKGGSSYKLFRKFQKFQLRYPKRHFWSAGNFIRTVGDVDLETTTHYVKNQVDLHQTTLSTFGI